MEEVTLEYVEQLADQLPVEEQRTLADRLVTRLRKTQPLDSEQRHPRDLYGIWRGYFPDDLDLDAALFEIRHEWEKDWPEVFTQ